MRHIRISALLSVVVAVLITYAGTGAARSTATRTFRSVVVTLTDGSVVEGYPDGQFFIDYQSGMVVLTDAENADLYLDASKIKGWRYHTLTENDITTGVDAVEDDTVRFSLTGEALHVYGAAHDVVVYDVQGRVVASVRKTAAVSIPFSQIGPGVHIVGCGTATFKFRVR